MPLQLDSSHLGGDVIIEAMGQPSYETITETPYTNASAEQMSILYTRYDLARRYAAGRDVLEVACGAGVGIGLISGNAKTVVGGDIDSKNCEVAQRTYEGRQGIKIQKLDAQALPFGANSLGMVILFEAIYYLQDPNAFISEAMRVLDSGGVLLISSVNPQWTGFNPSPFSTKYYSATELVVLLRAQGFEAELYAAFRESEEGPVAAAVHALKVVAVKLHLIPKTMKGKEFLKRIFLGRLTPIPCELTPNIAPLEPLVRIEEAEDLTKYKMLYAVARRAKQPEELK
jgi:ubiquinone/menaquinone biosynthesis C-methylase UbiE